jgi:membrane protein implicated in regulation of membrane protease activity
MSFDDLAFWHWFALAAVFILLEIFVPGIAFMWLGIAAVVAGIALYVLPDLSIGIQALLFAVVAVLTTVVARIVIRKTASPSDHPGLNRRGQQHVGSVYLLVDGTENGEGKVTIGDSVWSVRLSPGHAELPKGASVRVVDGSSATLVVEPETSASSKEPPAGGDAETTSSS